MEINIAIAKAQEKNVPKNITKKLRIHDTDIRALQLLHLIFFNGPANCFCQKLIDFSRQFGQE